MRCFLQHSLKRGGFKGIFDLRSMKVVWKVVRSSWKHDGDSDNNGISLSSNGSKDRNTGSQGRKSPKPAIWS